MNEGVRTIEVPCGVRDKEFYTVLRNSVVAQFVLLPSVNGDWVTELKIDGQTVEVESLELLFRSRADTDPLLQRLQAAILIVDIHSDAVGQWSFAEDGVVLNSQDPEAFSLTSQVLADGKSLIVRIDNVANIPYGKTLAVAFQYLAYYEEEGCRIAYLSQDPSVGLGRIIT